MNRYNQQLENKVFVKELNKNIDKNVLIKKYEYFKKFYHIYKNAIEKPIKAKEGIYKEKMSLCPYCNTKGLELKKKINNLSCRNCYSIIKDNKVIGLYGWYPGVKGWDDRKSKLRLQGAIQKRINLPNSYIEYFIIQEKGLK